MSKMSLKEKLNPNHTALVVIDIQKDFASPEGKLAKLGRDLSMVEPTIDAIENLITLFEQFRIPTLYVRGVHNDAELSSLQKKQIMKGEKAILADHQTGGHEFYRLKPPQNMVFTKTTYSAFSCKPFIDWLEENEIETLVISGMDTSYCVESTLRSAFDKGYSIIVPRDMVACSAKNINLHNNTLKMVDKVFGVTTDLEEIRKTLGT